VEAWAKSVGITEVVVDTGLTRFSAGQVYLVAATSHVAYGGGFASQVAAKKPPSQGGSSLSSLVTVHFKVTSMPFSGVSRRQVWFVLALARIQVPLRQPVESLLQLGGFKL
jgi:hypothetical protein